MVYEFRLVKAIPTFEMLYNIKVLHCMAMTRVTGIARLVNIVLDDSGQHLRGYLLEHEKFRFRLDRVTENLLLPWKTCERWAKQLVERVYQLHRRGFVVGTLSNIPILIDALDEAYLLHFRQKYYVGFTFCSGTPPEYRHLRRASLTTSGDLDRTPKSDIFQLGMVLWLLAENSPWTSNSAACIRERCTQRSYPCSDQSHIDPIALPPLDQSIPVYYRGMVNACRAECPHDRPAARRLLQSFPSTSDDAIYPR